MTQVQLITQLISKLDTNQMALQAALEEVSLWIRQRGSEDVAGNINGALDTLTQNAAIIAQGIAELTVSSGIDTWRGE
jgi:hypothetical protein